MNLLLFPGQGVQKVGMASDLVEAFPAARDTLAAIDEALDFPLSRLMAEGPAEELQQTHNTQPAILAHSAAVLAVVKDRVDPVGAAAGHSLGEYSAYVAAGSLTAVEAAKLVRRRGELMHEAGTKQPGAMAAVLGLPGPDVARICQEVEREGRGIVVPANLNEPDQTVISGDTGSVGEAGERCQAAGARRVVPLKVSGAFHSPLMAVAVPGLREALAGVRFRSPEFPVFSNATAAPVDSPADAVELLAEQLTAPVRWLEIVQNMRKSCGPDAPFLEVGPGSGLSGLVRRILAEPRCIPLGTAAEVERFLA